MNIILIGYRATGKTAVGMALSKRLQIPFFDADVYLEGKLGTTIRDIVSEKGWPFFRAREKDIIRELSSRQDCVIATGGGAVMDKDNVACLGKKGTFVLLKADIETIIQRIQGDETSPEQRPNLLDCDLHEETRKLVEQRMPTYARVADMSVDTTNLTIDEVVESIIAYLQLE